MTHFTVGIILPHGVHDAEGFIAEVMEPYFEHADAEPYVCYTLERAAADLASTIHRLELIINRSYHEQFNDQGEPVSTYNPDSKWDWYVIGGRWDGWINDLDTSRESLADNTALTEEAIAREKIPHAIITPDGEWHERGQMGWWAMLLTENENWEQEARALLASYRGHRVVIVDAHI
jgi:hypothetical protein